MEAAYIRSLRHPGAAIAMVVSLLIGRPAWSQAPPLAREFVRGGAVSAVIAKPTHLFTDVSTSAPYHDMAHFMKSRGITDGCLVDAFCPNDNLTRGQMAVFVIRGIFESLTGTPDGFQYPSTPYFTDVPANHQFFKWIQKMKEIGITLGTGDGSTYSPDAAIPRWQLGVFTARGWQFKKLGYVDNSLFPGGGSPCFWDVGSGTSYFPYIQKVGELRVFNQACGTGGFSPDLIVTRADAAYFIVHGVMGEYAF